MFQGGSLATFGSYTAGTNTNITNGTFINPTSTFRSGTAVSGSQPNSLKMDGLGFNVDPGTMFAVSTLQYHNGQTLSGTAATDVGVDLNLKFTAPPGTPNQSFAFSFHFDLTPNNASPPSNPANDDILTPQNVFSANTFTVDGQTYTLHLLGFSNDGGTTLTPSFLLPEDATVNSTLYAELTTQLGPQAVPEPTTLVLGATGALLLLGVRRLRRKPAAV